MLSLFEASKCNCQGTHIINDTGGLKVKALPLLWQVRTSILGFISNNDMSANIVNQHGAVTH